MTELTDVRATARVPRPLPAPRADRGDTMTDEADVHLCSCGHAPKWHHDTRGCGYLGHAPDRRCPCLLTSDASIDTRLAAARAEGARDMRTILARCETRIRHDHAYPMEVGPHHCDGCDLEADLRALLADGVEPQ